MTSRYDIWKTAAPEDSTRVYIHLDDQEFSAETNLTSEIVKVTLLDMDTPEERDVLTAARTNNPDFLYTIRLYKEEGKFRVEADSIDELEVFVNGEPVDVTEMDDTMIQDEELLSTSGT